MNREAWIWTAVLALGVLALAGRSLVTGNTPGVVHTRIDDTIVTKEGREWEVHRTVTPDEVANEQRQQQVSFNLPRTLGLWIAALLTLFTFSFLYRDNVFYKFAEALVVGVSAAYAMVVAFWTEIIPNLVGRLSPTFVSDHLLPDYQEERNLVYVVPLLLGIMLLMRLSPKGSWLARWPLAFIIGTTAGFRLVTYLQADLSEQIKATFLPLIAATDSAQIDLWLSLRNTSIILAVLACLTYFFFSVEHKGIAGRVSRVGIWVLMITFGASFAYTVMGRITLLIKRIEFLVSDWLRLV